MSLAGTSPSVNFGNVNVCAAGKPSTTPCSKTLALTYNVTRSGTLGTTKVLTGGAPNLDFTLASGSTCIGSVTAGQTCTVNVKFAPQYAGERPGGVQITNESGNVLATTLIYGIGFGPQLDFNTPSLTPVQLQGVLPGEVAADGAGNFYAVGSASNTSGAPLALVKLPAGGGPQITLPLGTLTQEQAFVFDMAVDGAGDIFLTDSTGVDELPAGGGAMRTLPFTGSVIDVAVDNSGDVFVTGGGTSTNGFKASVVELPAGGGPQVILPFSGLDEPGLVAVDSAGDVFVSETPASHGHDNLVLELTPNGTQKTVVTVPYLSDFYIRGLALDGTGSLFVTAQGPSTTEVLEVPAGGSSATTIANYPYQIGQLAVDPAGDFFFTDVIPTHAGIAAQAGYGELRRSQGPALTFSEVGVGTTGTVPLTISNGGNSALTATPVFSSTNFQLQSTSPDNCLAGIPASGTCTLQIGFSPSAEGRQSGTMTLETNGNANPVVSLEGSTGIAPPVLSLPSGAYTTTQTVSITDASPDATIYYTTDGTMPTASSTPYSGPISVTSNERLTAIAIVQGNSPSPAASAAYTIQAASSADSFNFSRGLAGTVPISFVNAQLDGTRLQLTNGVFTFQSASSFYDNPINIQSFSTYFTFQLTNAMADGFTFTVQNNNPNESDGSGGALGYQGMPNSVAIKFDLHDNAGEGPNSTGLYVNGAAPTVPAINLTGTGIDLHNQDIIDAQITYDGKTLVLTLTDTATLKTWSHSFAINIPTTVGSNTAYVGFTAATGNETADQEILSWTYVAGPPGAPAPPPSAPVIPAVPDYAAGFNAVGMATNGTAAVSGMALQLTDGGLSEAGGAFYSSPLNIQSFATDFTFQLTNPLANGYFKPTNSIADGLTFTIQNAGAYALGGLGGGLGYQGIGKSVAIKFDLHDNDGEGVNSTGLYLNGVAPTVPAIDLTGTGIDLHSGHLFASHITYDGRDLNLTLTDTVTEATWSHSFPIAIPATVGSNTAFVGFTGGTGGDTAIQQILNWTFTNP